MPGLTEKMMSALVELQRRLSVLAQRQREEHDHLLLEGNHRAAHAAWGTYREAVDVAAAVQCMIAQVDEP